MRVMVTGGAGFIGSHIADALVRAGHELLVLDDLSNGKRENVPAAARFSQTDIRDAGAVERVFAEFIPEVVCHQAAQTSVSVSAREPARDAMVNIIGGINVLQACVRRRVARIVFASTGGAIYGEVPEGRCAGVDWMPAPLSPYGCAKFAFEHYLHGYRSEHGLQFSILRYANVYGPRQDPHGEAGVAAIFTSKILRGEPVEIFARRKAGDPGCVRDYVYVRDVVEANLRAIAGGQEEAVVNVGTEIGTTTLELAKIIQRAAGNKTDIRFGPRRAGDLERSVLAIKHTHSASAPVPLEQGIAETVAWFRAQDKSAA